jgi:hypothetical protein
MEPMADSPQMIFRPLRVLIVEDVKSDITLLLLALHEGGFEVSSGRTGSRNNRFNRAKT